VRVLALKLFAWSTMTIPHSTRLVSKGIRVGTISASTFTFLVVFVTAFVAAFCAVISMVLEDKMTELRDHVNVEAILVLSDLRISIELDSMSGTATAWANLKQGQLTILKLINDLAHDTLIDEYSPFLVLRRKLLR
jgi:hypothetical protein